MIAGRELIASALPEFTAEVERGQLRLFAHVTGETDPVYLDVDTARQFGYPDLPVPPTFLFSLELQRPDPHGVLRELGVELNQVLHGEQHFTYQQMAHAGEQLAFTPRITDYYERKGGALRFVVRETRVTRLGSEIASLRNVLIILDEAAR